MNRFIPLSTLFPLLLLLLQLHQFCTVVNAENTHTGGLSCFAATERMDRLATLLNGKFIGDDVKELEKKLENAGKILNSSNNTKDRELCHLVASFVNYDINTAKEENVRMAQKFVAYIYTMIMDTYLINVKNNYILFKDFEEVFSGMHKVKPILKNECEKRKKKKYMKGANPMQKGTSVSGLLYMPLDKLENIEKISILEDRSDEKDDKDVEKLNAPSAGGNYYAVRDKMEKIVNILEEVLIANPTSSLNASILSKPAEFAEKIKQTTGHDNNDKEVMIIYKILAKKSGYGPLLITYNTKKAEEQNGLKTKLGSKLLKMLADFFVLIQKTFIHDSVNIKMYAEIYEKLIPVLAYYGKKKDWKRDLQEAERKLAEKQYEYSGIGNWGWIYASDKFYSDHGSHLFVKTKQEGNNPKHAVHGGHGRR